uniref:Uncharacterized protein n=1 Tax=Nelumbo nucifera TaxID=4432 RepID=A0A822Y5X0_NELNU|nr:TPA_asm: hypothetical protein HUJ06_029100 [Nelumbo nucifera]
MRCISNKSPTLRNLSAHSNPLQITSINQPYRTSYYFQPPRNWMNGFLTC